jgi:drug/metabolite transporter (DMT)-like permease
MGVVGQYLFTLGFRYVSPVKGGIISLFRILLAAFLGPYITSDPALKMSGWIGALLILGANVYFIVRKTWTLD